MSFLAASLAAINLKLDPGIKNKLCNWNIHGNLCILKAVKFKLIGAKVSFTEYQCGSGWLERLHFEAGQTHLCLRRHKGQQ